MDTEDEPLELPDPAELSFARLRAQSPALAETIAQLHEEMEQPKDAVAGFQSSI